jgi:hypothetical protein
MGNSTAGVTENGSQGQAAPVGRPPSSAALYTAAVAQRLPDVTPEDPPPADEPQIDPWAVRNAYRLHRARRKARIEHQRRTKLAGIRFWLVLVVLLVGSVVVAFTIWHEIQQLFGL